MFQIDNPVQVYIQLKRPSDDATSDALKFQLTPLDAGRPFFWSLRRNIAQKGDYSALASILQTTNKNGLAAPTGDDNNNGGVKITGTEDVSVTTEDQVSVTVADIPQPGVVLVSDDREDSRDIDNDLEELIVRDLLCEDSKVPDVGNYTSFQMAMKNPCEVGDSNESYEDVIPPPPRPTASKPPVSLKQPVSPTHSDDSAPPLPPKRAKKSETPKPEKKLSLFQKLFSTGRRKKDKRVSRRDSLRSLPCGMIEVDSNQINNKTIAEPQNKMNNNEMELDTEKDPEITEAEHYALYTSVAPHATASEFDEMSFYYSQVEGRKAK